MENTLKNLEQKAQKGLYSLYYGYSNHRMLFVASRAEVEKYKSACFEIETSNHAFEEVEMSNATLITEDADFIEKFEALKLFTADPLEYCEDLDIEEEQFNL